MLFAGVITGIGFLQFFEEPFVMTQGGPLNSTLSVAYLRLQHVRLRQLRRRRRDELRAVRRRGALTIIQFRCSASATTRPARAPLVPPHGRCVRMSTVRSTSHASPAAPSAPTSASRRPARGSTSCSASASSLVVDAVRLDVPRVGQDRGRAARQPAHVVAAGPDARQLPRAVHPPRLPAVLHQLHSRRRHGDAGQPGVLLDARVRVRQARLLGPHAGCSGWCWPR